ncbi:HD domain-containing phosphohydrolase, partial [Bdellovibrionota bacterium FG-2]
MAKQRVDDYLAVPLGALFAEEGLPCPLFQYSSKLRQIILWKSKGSAIDGELLDLLQDRGVHRFWIRKSDQESFAQSQASDSFDSALPGAPVRPLTESGDKIVTLLLADGVELRYKKGGAASEARKVVEELTRPNSVAEQKPETAKAREVVQDVLHGLNCDGGALASEIWKIAELEPELGHGVNVATYTVLFALAFGKIESSLLSDLAMAGLLHDVGISQIPYETASLPWMELDPENRGVFVQHVNHSLSLIRRLDPRISERVQRFVLQHHEKFDGTGYPQKLKGFKFESVAQILGMADLLDTVA